MTQRRATSATFFLLLILLAPARLRATADLPPIPPAISAQLARLEGLPAEQRAVRTARAAELRRAAADSRDGPRRLDWLGQAVDQDPADVANWLALAEQQLLMGYEEAGTISLSGARLALDRLPAAAREAASGDFALAMAWWHYRRAEWKQGAEWARVAVRRDAGLEGHLVLQLNRVAPVASRKELADGNVPFLPLDGGGNRAADVAWILALHDHFHLDWLPPERAELWKRRDTAFYEHDVQRWRDFGARSESHDYGGSAADYYGKSIAALPCPEGGWLRRHEARIPRRETELAPLPFWTNPDDGYVTGSQLAYLGWLRDSMLAARDPRRADRWARLVVAYYERINRRNEMYAWPELWLAEAQLELDDDEAARLQTLTAIDTFKNFKQTDPALGRLEGRLQSRKRNWGRALPLLRQAVLDFPDDAATWCDLAVAEAGLGHDPQADRAFDRALALDLDRAQTWRARGRVACDRDDLQSAQADLERALQLAPADTTLREELMATARSAAERIRN